MRSSSFFSCDMALVHHTRSTNLPCMLYHPPQLYKRDNKTSRTLALIKCAWFFFSRFYDQKDEPLIMGDAFDLFSAFVPFMSHRLLHSEIFCCPMMNHHNLSVEWARKRMRCQKASNWCLLVHQKSPFSALCNLMKRSSVIKVWRLHTGLWKSSPI